MASNTAYTDKQLRSAGGAAYNLIHAAELEGKGVSEVEINSAIQTVLGVYPDVASSWYGYMMMHYASGRHDKVNHMWYQRHGKAGRNKKEVTAEPRKETTLKEQKEHEFEDAEVTIKRKGLVMTVMVKYVKIILPIIIVILIILSRT